MVTVMARAKTFKGVSEQGERPEWGPLIELVGEERVVDFMWMYEVRLEDETKVHVYKHVETRRCLHLASGCRAYFYTRSGRYQRTPVASLIPVVFRCCGCKI